MEGDSQNSATNAQLKFGRWYASWILGALVSLMCLYYVLFHLLLRIPARQLYWPAVVHIAATILIGPMMFKAVTRFAASKGRDFGVFYIAAALLMFSTTMCWIYFGLRTGVLPHDQAGALYAIVVPCGVLGPIGAFYIRRRWYRAPNIQKGADASL